jgi:uncharacterized protein
MISSLWINLPVNDIDASVRFYSEIGFTLNEKYTKTGESASFFIGENNIVLMIFQKSVFQNITERQTGDYQKTTEVLFSIDSESIESIIALSMSVTRAGGIIIREPNGDKNMYGFSFLDIDGHSWNALYMSNTLKR